MLERQIKELSIKKENCSKKSELSMLFWNMFVMYFDTCLYGYVFELKKASILATLLQPS